MNDKTKGYHGDRVENSNALNSSGVELVDVGEKKTGQNQAPDVENNIQDEQVAKPIPNDDLNGIELADLRAKENPERNQTDAVENYIQDKQVEEPIPDHELNGIELKNRTKKDTTTLSNENQSGESPKQEEVKNLKRLRQKSNLLVRLDNNIREAQKSVNYYRILEWLGSYIDVSAQKDRTEANYNAAIETINTLLIKNPDNESDSEQEQQLKTNAKLIINSTDIKTASMNQGLLASIYGQVAMALNDSLSTLRAYITGGNKQVKIGTTTVVRVEPESTETQTTKNTTLEQDDLPVKSEKKSTQGFGHNQLASNQSTNNQSMSGNINQDNLTLEKVFEQMIYNGEKFISPLNRGKKPDEKDNEVIVRVLEMMPEAQFKKAIEQELDDRIGFNERQMVDQRQAKNPNSYEKKFIFQGNSIVSRENCTKNIQELNKLKIALQLDKTTIYPRRQEIAQKILKYRQNSSTDYRKTAASTTTKDYTNYSSTKNSYERPLSMDEETRRTRRNRLGPRKEVGDVKNPNENSKQEPQHTNSTAPKQQKITVTKEDTKNNKDSENALRVEIANCRKARRNQMGPRNTGNKANSMHNKNSASNERTKTEQEEIRRRPS